MSKRDCSGCKIMAEIEVIQSKERAYQKKLNDLRYRLETLASDIAYDHGFEDSSRVECRRILDDNTLWTI